jgi:hypothetical protein
MITGVTMNFGTGKTPSDGTRKLEDFEKEMIKE